MIRKRFSINELYKALIVRDTRFFFIKILLGIQERKQKKY